MGYLAEETNGIFAIISRLSAVIIERPFSCVAV
jgi:hypothetical protein